MKFILSTGALLLSSALAQATPIGWAFSYTGFYDTEAGTFRSDMRFDGSFSGTDSNRNGVLERGELTSLLFGGKDYVACGAASNAYYHCGADTFTYSARDGLAFSLGEYGGDPEGWNSSGHLITSGQMSYDYQITPYATSEHHLMWTDATALALTSLPPRTSKMVLAAMTATVTAETTAETTAAAVPEAPTWALMLAGLAGLAVWGRRRGA
jgi:MYXO-CTERM domain-containing protein